ncbi:hypothetical protein BASA81_006216 [Batrachochytrium salamandrivorans]|nr:hypothetical protein BASA81_006216 [Batrachochytrium salamandrivorans]
MKFGKELLRAAAASESIVPEDSWIDYKVLKKMLKHNPMEEDNGEKEVRNQKERITNSEVERNFFLALQAELRKVENQFSALKAQALRNAHEALAEGGIMSPQDALRRCTDAHLFLLIVENFGVLNYCGFKKILKKHDKLRSVTTRDSYMVRMVNNKSFSHSSEFRQLLERLEAQYEQLNAAAAAALPSSASSEVPSAAAAAATTTAACSPNTPNNNEAGCRASFESQRRELQEIALQGNDRLKSLASVVVSMDEDERKRLRLESESPQIATSSNSEPEKDQVPA